jgi:hypothetical protein
MNLCCQKSGTFYFAETGTFHVALTEKSNNLEKRAIIVSLAHPKFLDEEKAKFCFEITNTVLKQMNKENNFDVLKNNLL